MFLTRLHFKVFVNCKFQFQFTSNFHRNLELVWEKKHTKSCDIILRASKAAETCALPDDANSTYCIH